MVVGWLASVLMEHWGQGAWFDVVFAAFVLGQWVGVILEDCWQGNGLFVVKGILFFCLI